MNEQDWKSMIRFLEVLPKSGDKELTLLKAHLGIEEVLTQILAKNCINIKYLNDAKLQFHQKAKLVRAFNQIHRSEWVWQALHLLNKARNQLSHNLTNQEIQNKMQEFTDYVALNKGELFEPEANGKFSDFHMAAFATYIPLAAYSNFEPKAVSLLTEKNA